MSFRITGLDPAAFRHLFGQTDAALAEQGVKRYIAGPSSGFPDRIELRDAEAGDSLLLLNYTHQPADTPYRASHAIFVREGAQEAFDKVDEVPATMRVRPISLRAFAADHMLIDADLASGADVDRVINRLLDDTRVRYLQAHFAKQGCYAARIERA